MIRGPLFTSHHRKAYLFSLSAIPSPRYHFKSPDDVSVFQRFTHVHHTRRRFKFCSETHQRLAAIEIGKLEAMAMADHVAGPDKHESVAESLIDKMMRNRSNDDSDSSSSDSDDEYRVKRSASDVKPRGYRLVGRDGSVHKILGGGKAADILLWKEQKASARVLGVATVVWVLFELLEYHLLTLVCHILMLLQVTIFLMTNASGFLNKPRPKIPEVTIPLDTVLKIASAFRIEFNTAFGVVRDIASGRDVKKFLVVIVVLSVLSVLGNCFSFLTLCYLGVVFLLTVPLLYEKNEDQINAFAEKAEEELRKQYSVLNDKVLSKIPKGPLKDKFQ